MPFLVGRRRRGARAPKSLRRIRGAAGRIRLVVMSGIVVAAHACGGDDRPPLASLAVGCLVNTDCNAPLVCAFRKCHEACLDSRDCKGRGQRCVASDRPYHVCQLVDERDCTYNSDCALGQTCGVDFQCRDPCAADRDCLNLQICVGGTCADLAEVDAGLFTGNSGPDAGSGQRCLYTSECQAPLVCRNHACSVECRAATDCAAGTNCVNNRCTTGAGVTIGVGGGVLTAASGKLVLSVPANALSAPVALAIFSLEAWPGGALGPVFEIVPSGTVFREPATLTYRYDDADIGGASPAALRVALATGAAWHPLASTVDASTRTVTTTLQHLSVYGLVGPDGTFATAPDAGSSMDGPFSRADASANDASSGETASPTGAGGSLETASDAPAPEASAPESGRDAGVEASLEGGHPVIDGGSGGTGGTSSGSGGSGGSSGSGGSADADVDADATIDDIDDAALEGATNDVTQTTDAGQCVVFCDGASAPCSCATTCVESTYSFRCDFDDSGAGVCTCSQDGTAGPVFPSDTCDPNLLRSPDPGCGYPIQAVVGTQ